MIKTFLIYSLLDKCIGILLDSIDNVVQPKPSVWVEIVYATCTYRLCNPRIIKFKVYYSGHVCVDYDDIIKHYHDEAEANINIYGPGRRSFKEHDWNNRTYL